MYEWSQSQQEDADRFTARVEARMTNVDPLKAAVLRALREEESDVEMARRLR